MGRFCLFFFILFPVSTLWAQEKTRLDNIEEIQSNCQIIVDHFSNDAVSEAFKVLRGLWILPNDEIDFLEQKSIEQMNIIEGRFGKIVGNKLVKDELIEEVAYKITWVVKYDYNALRYQFIFYNGKDNKWQLNSFKWDDNIAKLFEE